jgi:predicted N-acyltransferase
MSCSVSSPDIAATFQLRAVSNIAAVGPAAWDACVRSSGALRSPSDPPSYESKDARRDVGGNPFVSYAFLSALEISQCVGRRAGWLPQHLVLEDERRQVLGAVPCYLKTHSQGEYVFDHAWADAHERAGGTYYPKMQVSVPFTPATGPRLLLHPDMQADAGRAALAEGLIALCHERRASGVHVTFLQPPDRDALTAKGYLLRTDQQFHWDNPGYSSFEDFLNALSSRKRKFIRRERREALAPGISIDWLTAFYMDTGSRKWGRPYLNREFFSLIGESMCDRILLVMAKRGGRYIAGAINFLGDGTLFGRHWGAIEHHPFLHFEVCYYQAMDYAIAHKIARVEAGAQGEHKLARGYAPVTTYSAHYIADPGFRRAIADYLKRERLYVDAAGRELAAYTPFRKSASTED